MLKIQSRIFVCLLFLDVLLFIHGWWSTIRSWSSSSLPFGHYIPPRETKVGGEKPYMIKAHPNRGMIAWHTQPQHLRSTLRSWKNIVMRLNSLLLNTWQRFPSNHSCSLFNVVNLYFWSLILWVSLFDTITASIFSLSLSTICRKTRDFWGGNHYSCK